MRVFQVEQKDLLHVRAHSLPGVGKIKTRRSPSPFTLERFTPLLFQRQREVDSLRGGLFFLHGTLVFH